MTNYFKDGLRVLFAVTRDKDGQPNQYMEYKISRNIDDYDTIVDYLKHKIQNGGRIYCSVNRRNPKKAIKHLLDMSLNSLFADEKQLLDFISHPTRQFISSLMQPSSADDKLFLWDLDNKNLYNETKLALSEWLIDETETKNGYHFITYPFDPKKVNLIDVEMKKNAFYLVYYKDKQPIDK